MTNAHDDAIRANQSGNDERDAGRSHEAERYYRQAIACDATYAAAWFNLGIVRKLACDWAEARHCAERAIALGCEYPEGAHWNIGIATTALCDWRAARAAWRAAGIAIPDGDGPIEMKLSATPIRLRIDDAEVVWCKRIDPARAIVRSIPLPETGRRFGDLLLHDGAPNGYRMLGEVEVPVFDELALLASSEYSTYRIALGAPDAASVDSLIAAFDGLGMGAEDWTASVHLLCRACSEGRPGDHQHDSHTETQWQSLRDFAVASVRRESVERVLATWATTGPSADREFDTPECVVQARAKQ